MRRFSRVPLRCCLTAATSNQAELPARVFLPLSESEAGADRLHSSATTVVLICLLHDTGRQ